MAIGGRKTPHAQQRTKQSMAILGHLGPCYGGLVAAHGGGSLGGGAGSQGVAVVGREVAGKSLENPAEKG